MTDNVAQETAPGVGIDELARSAQASNPGNVDMASSTAATVLGLTIDIPDLRNGDPANIGQAAPKASVANEYKWCHIKGMTHSAMVPLADHVIRAQYSQLLSVHGGQVTDAQRTEARNNAIMLGAVRVGASAAYRLTPADLNSKEVSSSGSKVNLAEDVSKSTVGADDGSATSTGKHTLAMAMGALTPTEVKVVGMLIYLGMAVPVLQGISLVLSGHHYLPTTRNTFAGMRRQALQVGGTEVAAWVEQQGDRFDDMVFHKACHPISPPRKRSWAKDSNMAVRLGASGHGAAAIRLPALPSDAQGGKAAVAVVEKAMAVIRGMKHTVQLTEGPRLIRAVEAAPEGREEVAAVVAVKTWLQTHASQIAFCAGIVQAVNEAGTGGRETTLIAYSIRKITSEKQAEVSRGTTYARAYLARLREDAMSGVFPDPEISV